MLRRLAPTLFLALPVLHLEAQARVASPAAAPPPHAALLATVDSSLFRGLHYRMVGPNRGGRVTTVTGVPSEPKTFYMGVASGGVFRTTDGGLN
ncbi:MAG TPA: hypothetical protein VMH39_17610, partial [Gemmatimonadaceae bacterium]|nr:hypothetical protein [Gemmatimonadaceae bacterium]